MRFLLCHGDEGEPCLLGPYSPSVWAGRMDSLTWGGSHRLGSSEVKGRPRTPFSFPRKRRVVTWRQDQELGGGCVGEGRGYSAPDEGQDRQKSSELVLYSQRSDIQVLPQADLRPLKIPMDI